MSVVTSKGVRTEDKAREGNERLIGRSNARWKKKEEERKEQSQKQSPTAQQRRVREEPRV
jgi:hypothetical protein